MNIFSKRQILIFSLWGVLFFSAISVLIISLYQYSQKEVLTVAFLDVGQGDSIFIEAPNGTQLLIDGGPHTEVLSKLARVMSLWDKSIDIVLATHPDADHVGGLPSVFERFDVSEVIVTGAVSDTAMYSSFTKAIADEKAHVTIVRRGMKIILDKDAGVYLDILFPDKDVSDWDANDGSIVARLVYGDESFLLTGDSPIRIETYLGFLDGVRLQSTVLKLGHHGSKTSSSEAFLRLVSPEYAIISAGCNNRYGHPHEEVMERILRLKIKNWNTCEKGTIIFETNGKNMSTKFKK